MVELLGRLTMNDIKYYDVIQFEFCLLLMLCLLSFMHFCQILQRIPHAFLKNLSGLSLGKCALKGPSGKRWIVELEERENGLFFHAAGWQGFVKDHLLQVGDFLVFYYYGESKFKVKIYDKSACEKDVEEADGKSSNPVSLENKGNQARVKEEIVESEAENYDTDCENTAIIANRGSGKL